MNRSDDTMWSDEPWINAAPSAQQIDSSDVRQVMIDGGHGDLEVAWHDDAQVRVHGPDTEVIRQADTLIIHRRRKGDRLVVGLPGALPACSISLQHGRLTLTSSRGLVHVSTGSGSIHVADGQGDLTLHTGSGSIHGERLVGPLNGQTGSGSIHLTDVAGAIAAHTGSGSIRITGGAGEVHARTGSGAIRVDNRQSERLALTTGSGSVTISGGQAGMTDARTGSGSITCTAVLGPAGHDLVTNSGSITLGVPRGLPARIEATTGHGRIDTDLPLVTVGQRGPKSQFGRRLVGSLGDGAPRAEIRLRTGRGDIWLRWLDSSSEADAPAGGEVWSEVSTSLGRAVGDLTARITQDVASAVASVSFPSPPPAPWTAPPDTAAPPPPAPAVGRVEPAFVPAPPPPSPPPAREAEQRRVLAALAAGEISIAEAEQLLAALEPPAGGDDATAR